MTIEIQIKHSFEHYVNKRYDNNTVHCSPFWLIGNDVVYCSSNFVGVIIWGLFHPVSQVIPWGFITTTPHFWQACPCALAVSSGFFADYSFLSSSIEGRKPPLYRWWGSLVLWVAVFHTREVDICSSLLLTCRDTYPVHSPSLFGLAGHDPV